MKAPARFPAIDVLGGLVMVLMTIDHASEAVNRGRFVTDSVFLWKPHTPIPPAQFCTRRAAGTAGTNRDAHLGLLGTSNV